VPESQITPLEMSVEDALKLVVTAGIITPPYRGDLAQRAGERALPGAPR
jgi:uncharacterized membrane protein